MIKSLRSVNKGVVYRKEPKKKYSYIARKRKILIFKEKLSSLNIRIPLKAVFFLLILIVVVVTLAVLRNSTFNITEVEVIAPDSIKNRSLEISNNFIGENIILLRESTISDNLKENIPEIDRVLLYKSLPSKIVVEIIQTNPSIIELSLTKINYLDVNAKFKGNLEYSEFPKFTEDESKILSGENLIDSKLVLDKYIEGKTDEEKLLIDWTKVTVSEKEKILNTLKEFILLRIEEYLNKVKEILKTTPYGDLPVVEVLDNNLSLDSKEIKDIMLVIDNLSSRDKSIKKIILKSEYSFEIETLENKKIIFSLVREITDQIKDLDSVIFYGYFNNARIIDLRTETYSIIY